MDVRSTDCLLVIDLQVDFLPGGRLAVKGGDEIVPLIERLARRFANLVMTQDWHPADHISFASRHPGRKPFELIELDYGPQVLWPDHCVIGTKGAEFAPGLDLPQAQTIIRKGYRRSIDSYSAFFDNDHRTPTGLAGYLRERGLTRLFVCGLATDFCVAWTALDAAAQGFETLIIDDASRPIDTNGSLAAAWANLDAAGVGRVKSADI